MAQLRLKPSQADPAELSCNGTGFQGLSQAGKGEEKDPFPAFSFAPRCRHFGPCGGCSSQDVAYPEQVDQKRRRLTQLLDQAVPAGALPEIQAVPMEDPWAYRAKMEFTFSADDQNRPTLGLHQRANFRRIVDIDFCEIAPPQMSGLLRALREAARASGLDAYSARSHQGFWRYAVIRASRARGELMLLLLTNEGSKEEVEKAARLCAQRVPELKSVYWGVTTRISDVARPERMELLLGQEFLEDRVGRVRLLLGPMTFIQPNLRLVSQVYDAILENARLTGAEKVFDLYCGVGLIALSLASRASVVCGVESEPDSAVLAERNALLNGIPNAVFVCGKSEDVIRKGALFKSFGRPDVAMVDPPRAGLHKEVVSELLRARPPRILYLSCNPSTLARDLAVLLEQDGELRMESVRMFDFFPHTPHLETLVTLARSSARIGGP